MEGTPMKSLYDMITDELAQMRADDERSAILAHEMRKACRPTRMADGHKRMTVTSSSRIGSCAVGR